MTTSLPSPADVDAIRVWLAEHAPDLEAVRGWVARVLDRFEPTVTVPELGSPAWVALADTDVRKLAAAMRPALAHLTERSPAATADRLRMELDEFALLWRRAISGMHNDISRGWRDLGYGIGPSDAELVRRRNQFPCPHCGTSLRYGTARCAACGWTEPTPEEIRARAAASWARVASDWRDAA